MNQTDTIDARLLDIMLRAGSRWVLWLLILLSAAAIAVMLERLWFYLQERTPRAQLDAALKALRTKGTAEALRLLEGTRSMEARVARDMISHAGDGAGSIEEYKAAAIEHERLRYEKRLAFLGTLGNNAPFIGLFGTVLGIIRAFHDIAGSTVQGTSAAMTGIGESLVATGVGLLVALPAVATYNAFMRHVETAIAHTEAYGHEILAFVKRDGQRDGDGGE